MPIEKLPEFAKDGQKNTDDLTLLDGFPVGKKPARQWFNYLFNMLSLKINEIIDLDPVARSEIADNLTTNDRAFGIGQTRKKDTLVLNTTYTNTSSKPWFVSMTAKNTSSGQPAFLRLKVNGNAVAVSQDVATPFNSNDVYVAYVTIEQIILPGESFIFENSELGRFECSSEIS